MNIECKKNNIETAKWPRTIEAILEILIKIIQNN